MADVSSRSVALSATACPAARNFSFCIEHQVLWLFLVFLQCPDKYRPQPLANVGCINPDGPFKSQHSGLQVVCSRCQRQTRLQEQFMHLSLELPEGVDEAARLNTQSLLQDHLQVPGGRVGPRWKYNSHVKGTVSKQAQWGHFPVMNTSRAVVCFLPQNETVEKTCEGCGAENVKHSVHHVLRRLPRVLALHFKRFRVGCRRQLPC